MKNRLSTAKRKEYDDLNDTIRELSQEIDRLEKEKKDTTETYKRLGLALDKCIEFVRIEIYNENNKIKNTS
jgi:cell division protein FtsB